MKEWTEYSKAARAPEKGGAEPSIWGYVAIRLIDSMLPVSVLVLTLIFFFTALFFIKDTDGTRLNWALHAAELCLGVFLGLLKGSIKR